MEFAEPEVRLIGRPSIDWDDLWGYAGEVGARNWVDSRCGDDTATDAEILIEAGGKVCYRSWEPGLNPNVTKVRADREEYLKNILSSGHGSVLEHAVFTFALHQVSRVVTHELVRHRVGTAISQESMRYVRFDQLPFWLPDWVLNDAVLLGKIEEHLAREIEFQAELTAYFDFHGNREFALKKKWTSFMRRFIPHGVATDMIWTANVRALRHVIETRTAPGAEEEIRIVAGKFAEIMTEECPALFGDFRRMPDGTWVPKWSRV